MLTDVGDAQRKQEGRNPPKALLRGREYSRTFDRQQKQGPGLLQRPEKSLDLQLHYHSIIITNTQADN